MEEWQAALLTMAGDVAEIKKALVKEIAFKNTLIYILLGVAFSITAIAKYNGGT